ncbi:CARDB domain-containing protein [Streptomyces sp. NBC_00268]|uniref:CARDB domain-containing protein n=1 Tax=Streptomyces sp. NBC_00268 TaxID=2975695 RepID=UPI00339072E4
MAPTRFPRYAAAAVIALGLLSGPATNTASAQPTGPDLVAGYIDGPTSVQPDQRAHYETCVENLGDQGTGVFNIAWYVSGERIGYGSHSGVPGHTKVCDGNSHFDWTVPNDPGGSRTIKWVVDEDNHVHESDASEITVNIGT